MKRDQCGRDWRGGIWISLLTLQMVLVAGLEAAPRVPRSDAEVLEHVPLRSGVDATRGIRGWGHLSYGEALDMARGWMKDWEKTHDPRLAGRVQAVLRRWWTQEDPPGEVRLIRARIRQHVHDFEGAITDLEKLVRGEGSTAQVWAMLSSLHLVRGDVTRAREAALELARRHPGLWATATAAAVAGVTGQAEQASQLLYRSLRQHGAEDVVLRAWAWGLLGELAAQRGRQEEAVKHLKTAMNLDPARGYWMAALVDQLLEVGRPEEAWSLLQDARHVDSDALMVRKVMVLKRLGRLEREGELWMKRLKAGFEAAEKRGLSRHFREEAMLHWHVMGDVARGLELALANWRVQKEPLDARLLAELARQAGDQEVLSDLRKWCQETGMEDVRLAGVLQGADASKSIRANQNVVAP